MDLALILQSIASVALTRMPPKKASADEILKDYDAYRKIEAYMQENLGSQPNNLNAEVYIEAKTALKAKLHGIPTVRERSALTALLIYFSTGFIAFFLLFIFNLKSEGYSITEDNWMMLLGSSLFLLLCASLMAKICRQIVWAFDANVLASRGGSYCVLGDANKHLEPSFFRVLDSFEDHASLIVPEAIAIMFMFILSAGVCALFGVDSEGKRNIIFVSVVFSWCTTFAMWLILCWRSGSKRWHAMLYEEISLSRKEHYLFDENALNNEAELTLQDCFELIRKGVPYKEIPHVEYSESRWRFKDESFISVPVRNKVGSHGCQYRIVRHLDKNGNDRMKNDLVIVQIANSFESELFDDTHENDCGYCLQIQLDS